jgi:protein-tyrosine-phosphatase
MLTILFVCTANVCRSPMAAGILNRELSERGLNSMFLAESAGIWGKVGLPVVPEVVKIMGERGIDVTNHRSRIITKEIIDKANLILTMERSHKEAIYAEFPGRQLNLYLISELVGNKFNIEDPINKPLEVFNETADMLTDLIKNNLEKIKYLSSN